MQTLKQDKTNGAVLEELICTHAVLFLEPIPDHIQDEIGLRTKKDSLPSVDVAGGRVLLFRTFEDLRRW
jgi:hypothetical protein